MANALTLQSSNEELKAYFEAVCKIVDSNSDEFPINLDEVWPLAYAEKGAAVRALKNGFIEDVDYKTVDTFTKREIGSTRTTDYFINVSCLEYLIARRRRNVFEVYRNVFHAARKGELVLPKEPSNPQLQFVQTQIYLAEAISRNLRLNDASRLGMYQSIAEPSRIAIPQYVEATGITKSLKDLLADIGSPYSAVKFNQMLVEQGYLENMTRATSGGAVKKFKNITDKGLPYGKNLQNPKNQKETQPHWYVDRFKEFYRLVTA